MDQTTKATFMSTWDGKIVLAGLYTAGYLILAVYIIKFGGLSVTQKELALVVLAALGPQLGQIYGAIYRQTAADERAAVLRSSDLQKAITTPSTMTAEPVQEAVENGVRSGLEKSEPVRVEPTTAADDRVARAADGQHRDWLDPPAPTPAPAETPTVPVGSTPVLED